MGVDDDLTGLLSVRVQKPKYPASLRPAPQRFLPAVPDDHTSAAGVITDIVGVVRELHCFQKLKCRPIINLGGAVTTAGDEQAIGGGIVEQSLRLLQIRKRP